MLDFLREFCARSRKDKTVQLGRRIFCSYIRRYIGSGKEKAQRARLG